MQTKFRSRILPLLQYMALAASVVLMSGCNSGKPIESPAAGGVSGTQQVLNNPNASAELKTQAAQQQQMGQQQALALQEANARAQASGQSPKN